MCNCREVGLPCTKKPRIFVYVLNLFAEMLRAVRQFLSSVLRSLKTGL